MLLYLYLTHHALHLYLAILVWFFFYFGFAYIDLFADHLTFCLFFGLCSFLHVLELFAGICLIKRLTCICIQLWHRYMTDYFTIPMDAWGMHGCKRIKLAKCHGSPREAGRRPTTASGQTGRKNKPAQKHYPPTFISWTLVHLSPVLIHILENLPSAKGSCCSAHFASWAKRVSPTEKKHTPKNPIPQLAHEQRVTVVLYQGGGPLLPYDCFMELFHRVFDQPAEGKKIREQLLTVTQGNRNASEYALEFRRLTAGSRWNKSALKEAFRQGLNQEVLV